MTRDVQLKEKTVKPWDGIISDEEQRAYRAAGFGKPTGFGKRPGLLIIDVQYRTVGTKPMPFWDAIKEFPTSCGEVGWKAVANIEKLLKTFRARGWPVLYPYVAPEGAVRYGPSRRQGSGADDRCGEGLRVCRGGRSAPGRYAGAQEASERILRHAACQLSDRQGHRLDHRYRMHDQRMRSRLGGRCIRLQLPRRGLSATRSTTAATSRIVSICSTCRRSTQT